MLKVSHPSSSFHQTVFWGIAGPERDEKNGGWAGVVGALLAAFTGPWNRLSSMGPITLCRSCLRCAPYCDTSPMPSSSS